jgi:hypothetical protein
MPDLPRLFRLITRKGIYFTLSQVGRIVGNHVELIDICRNFVSLDNRKIITIKKSQHTLRGLVSTSLAVPPAKSEHIPSIRRNIINIFQMKNMFPCSIVGNQGNSTTSLNLDSFATDPMDGQGEGKDNKRIAIERDTTGDSTCPYKTSEIFLLILQRILS